MIADPFVRPDLVEKELRTLSDSELTEFCLTEQEKIWSSFLLQCCAAYILGRKSKGGQKYLARALDLPVKKVEELAGVWEKIVIPIHQSGQAVPPLAPGFFTEALKASDPVKAIQIAADAKARDGSFSPYRLRRMINSQREDDGQAIVSCVNCQHFQHLKEVPVEVVIEGERYPLLVELKACRLKGILGIKMESDLLFIAEGCDDYWEVR